MKEYNFKDNFEDEWNINEEQKSVDLENLKQDDGAMLQMSQINEDPDKDEDIGFGEEKKQAGAQFNPLFSKSFAR